MRALRGGNKNAILRLDYQRNTVDVDDGRSFPKSISTRPIFFVRISWGSGAKPMKASILPSAKSCMDLPGSWLW